MLIGGGICNWFFMKAWHVVELKFDKTLTTFLFILWVFFFSSFKYSRCCLNHVFSRDLVFILSISSKLVLMKSMASSIILLFLLVVSMIGKNINDSFDFSATNSYIITIVVGVGCVLGFVSVLELKSLKFTNVRHWGGPLLNPKDRKK